MTKRFEPLMVVLLTFSGLAAVSAQTNWPNWRGPNFDGSQLESNPPSQWSANKNIRWKTDLPGEGSGSPIIWEDRIFLNVAIRTDRPGEPDLRDVPPGPGGRGFFGRGNADSDTQAKTYVQFAIVAVERTSGKLLWQTVVNEAVPHEQGHETNTLASGSPVTDGKHIYASFGSFGVYCLDWEGNILWSADLGKMTTRNQFGEASTPALSGNTLIVPWDQDGYEDKNGNGQRDDDELLSSLVALNTQDGSLRWRTPRPTEVTTWATPLIVEHGGRTQVITNGTTVRSYDLNTGELIWQCGGQVTNPIPSPIRFEDSLICMTGYRGNAIYSMRLDSQGDIEGTEQVNWTRNDAAPYVASATLYQGQLYLTKSRDGIMTSVDATNGEVLIPQTRLPGIKDMYASPVSAGGRIYFTGRNGVTTVIQHGKEFEVVAENDLGEPVDASPAIYGDEIFIRGAEHLYCISQSQ
ncbi:MAG: PQQ-binding-like beta-propeller repeat protein [bacterium]|nr:PQQ-binding-like beta-propeller repeat protein [bacterium]